MQGKSIKTPPLVGTILPGVTRMSLLQLAQDMGFTATEDNVSVLEALQADEVFTTGTAVGVCPVGSLTYKGKKTTFCAEDRPGPTCQSLYDALVACQTGAIKDTHKWVVPLDAMPEVVSAALASQSGTEVTADES